MLHVDVLSAYLICAVSALVGAAMLRFVSADARLAAGLQTCSAALLIVGVGLLPAGLGERAAHPAAQFSLAFGSIAAVVWMARGVAQIQGGRIPVPRLAALLLATAALLAAALAVDRMLFGQAFAAGFALASTLLLGSAGGFVRRPRDAGERVLGLALLLLALTSWLRMAFTLAHAGPPAADLLYVPPSVAPLYAALYGVLPVTLASLLLSLANTRLQQQLHVRAVTDELTGTMTRRALAELAPSALARALLGRREAAVLMLDLDRFKAVNDTYGHAAGDAVLRLAGATLKAQIRADTLLSRFGGEEFVVVVPVDDVAAARRVAERLRLAIEATDWTGALPPGQRVTVSVGVALASPADRLEDVLARADQALYRAKHEGRNQVQVELKAA